MFWLDLSHCQSDPALPLPSFKQTQVVLLNTKPSGLREKRRSTGMPSGIPEGAMCVQRFDDSRISAIHITYRISLRSSSMREPRDPLLKVLTIK